MEPATYYYAVGFCLLCAAAYWFLRETDDPTRPIDSITGQPLAAPKPRPPSRREELIAAREKIERQIEILQSPVGGGSLRNAPPNVEYEVAELGALLNEIDEELAELKA